MIEARRMSTKKLAEQANAQFFHLFDGGAEDPRLNEKYMRTLMRIAGRSGNIIEKRRLGRIVRDLRFETGGAYVVDVTPEQMNIYFPVPDSQQQEMRSLVEEHPEYFGFEGPFKGQG